MFEKWNCHRALINEAAFAQSKADFANKLSVAAKEANETKYWLYLLKETDYLDVETFITASERCEELIKLLAASIITSKKSLSKKCLIEKLL